MSPEKIKRDITTINQWPTRYGYPIKGIVIHSMWGSYAGSIAWFKNPKAQASAHYVISVDGEISLCVPEENTAWHAGVLTVMKEKAPGLLRDSWGINPNFITIGCELEDKRNKNHNYPAVEYESAILLVTDICKRHNIPISRDYIFMHKESDPINRSDPVGNWDHDKFIEDVKKQLEFGVEGGVEEKPKNEFYPVEPTKVVAVDPGNDGLYVRSEPIRRSIRKPKLLWPFYEIIQTNLSGSKFISPGKSFETKGFVRGEDVSGNNWWWVSKFGNYVWSGATVDKPDPTSYPKSIVDKILEGKKNMTVEELKIELEKLETVRDIELAEVAERHREAIGKAMAALGEAKTAPVGEVAPVVEPEAPVEAVTEEAKEEVVTEEISTVFPEEAEKQAKISELEVQLKALKGE